MSLSIAQYSGLSGLNANGRNIQVVGNNIANSNTIGFKSSRLLFANQISQNLAIGGAPSDTFGGANPSQVGLGVAVAGTQRNFNAGSLSTTGDFRDMAIEGDGMFIVQRGEERFFTRAGAFRQNSLNQLTTVTGERLMGYGIDSDFQIVPSDLQPVQIPLGQMRLAEATTEVRFTGNLNAGGDAASRGARLSLPAMTLIPAPALPALPLPIQATSLLTEVDDPNAAGDQQLFSVGQFIELNQVVKGDRELPNARLLVEAGSTVQDLMDFIRDGLGISTAAGANGDGFTPGVALDATTGVITIVGNQGQANDLEMGQSAIRILSAAGAPVASPFLPNKVAAADGESVRNTFTVFDSLGNRLSVDITMVLESKNNNNGTTWRYFVESGDDTDVALAVGTGTISFDNNGQLIPPLNTPSFSIDREDTGAETPVPISMLFASGSGSVSAIQAPSSTFAATYQDGTELGTLNSFSVGPDGVITGGFTNGLTRTIGQVVLGKFTNPEGLRDVGNNLFAVGPNSGEPIIATAQTLGTGRIVGGALELSNVDLAQEFITLIGASTGYSANSRVITTADQLLQQLLVLGR
jgi:flagellar hook protein FlgE